MQQDSWRSGYNARLSRQGKINDIKDVYISDRKMSGQLIVCMISLLTALAVSDLICLLALIWNNICLNPLFSQKPFIPFDIFEIVYMTAIWPHVVFSRISACITAFICTERCLCIVFPLSVKTKITRERVTVIIVCMTVIMMGSVAPLYYCNRFSWRFYSSLNRSVLQTDPTRDRQFIEDIVFAIANVSVPCLTFLVVIVTTAILVIKLTQKARWRRRFTVQKQSDAMFNRDRMLSKMVIVMSSVFVACYGPVCIIFIAMIVEKELSIYGDHKNVFGVVLSIAYIMESIHVSMNFIIYYKMSSRYRAIVRNMFHLGIRHSSRDFNGNIQLSMWLNKQGQDGRNKKEA
ncbi:hypothetical protein BsWGS_20089 [Bradybaena similaris]